MTRETLRCEYHFGSHPWTREAKRGRKPRSCPAHLDDPSLLVTKAGTVLTPELEQQLADEAEAGYEIVGYVDVPVTLRSTKTSKEAPGSLQEPSTPHLVTRGKGQGGKAASEPLGPAGLTPGEKALVHSSRVKDLAAAKIVAGSEDQAAVTLERDEKIASGEWQELYCQNGDHDWDRPTNRGRKPVNCPQHPNMIDLEANAEEKRRKAEERIDRLEADLKRHGTHISQHQPKEFTMPNRPEYQDKGPGQASHKDKPSKAGTSHKGMAKTVKATKRTEAEIRNEATTPERRSRRKKAA